VYAVLVIAANRESDAALLSALNEERIGYIVVSDVNGLAAPGNPPDAVVVDFGAVGKHLLPQLAERCQTLDVPMICAVIPGDLARYDSGAGASDFFMLPPAPGEIAARIKQARGSGESPADARVLHAGDLQIDLERYEVFSRGRRVNLTFKEYQLLCLLASNPGRVFTREALLNQIWEYDYYGGTRTVDVHIRRLRSKIEDTGHIYIETVWNVGYRFRTGDGVARSGTPS
jgi:DNA-binding response OmpR family regulator